MWRCATLSAHFGAFNMRYGLARTSHVPLGGFVSWEMALKPRRMRGVVHMIEQDGREFAQSARFLPMSAPRKLHGGLIGPSRAALTRR